jgi:putative transposase
MYHLPIRKNIRIAPQNYLGYQRYFVTLCSFRRQTVFSDPPYCQHLLDLLRTECASRNFRVPAYCLMPDHLHFLAEGLDPACDLLHLVKSFKIKSSRDYAVHEPHILWQKGFYDHILRQDESPESVVWYIWLNPVRKQIVSRAQDYPFAGSFTGLIMPASWDSLDWRPPWK